METRENAHILRQLEVWELAEIAILITSRVRPRTAQVGARTQTPKTNKPLLFCFRERCHSCKSLIAKIAGRLADSRPSSLSPLSLSHSAIPQVHMRSTLGPKNGLDSAVFLPIDGSPALFWKSLRFSPQDEGGMCLCLLQGLKRGLEV